MNTTSIYTVLMSLKNHPALRCGCQPKSVVVQATTFDDAKAKAERANPEYEAFRVSASNGFTDYTVGGK